MMKDDQALLRDMLRAAAAALRFAQGLDQAAFMASELHQDAIIRQVSIIGEAANRISPGFRSSHPQIPWKDMAGMRHRIVHNYADVDIDLVWAVVGKHLPDLIEKLRQVLPPEDTC
jgi:uncharacterized protein with HEPN domain